jgi:hypothetical protein
MSLAAESSPVSVYPNRVKTTKFSVNIEMMGRPDVVIMCSTLGTCSMQALVIDHCCEEE